MEFKQVDPPQAKELLDSDAGYVYLDVRSRREFAAGHAPGAVCVPIMDQNPAGPGMIPNARFVEGVQEKFSQDQKLVVACLRGPRSERAAQLLASAGFVNIVDMRGGYDGELAQTGEVLVPGWQRCGFPTVDGEG